MANGELNKPSDGGLIPHVFEEDLLDQSNFFRLDSAWPESTDALRAASSGNPITPKGAGPPPDARRLSPRKFREKKNDKITIPHLLDFGKGHQRDP